MSPLQEPTTTPMQQSPSDGADLISRADAIEALCHNCAYYTDAQCKTDSGYWCESGAMIREDIPSADRPHGEWIEVEDYNGDFYYQCDQCKEEYILIDGTPQDNAYNYCPNCGTRMENKK